MKTVEELFKEIDASKDLQKEITSIGKGQFAEIGAFLKKHDCDASAEDFVAFMKKQKTSQAEGEIGDDDAEAAAGGRFLWWPDSSDWDYGVSEHAD